MIKNLKSIVKDEQVSIVYANDNYAIAYDGARTFFKWRSINLTSYERTDVTVLQSANLSYNDIYSIAKMFAGD